MGVTKGGLRSFIDTKFSKANKEKTDHIEKYIEVHLKEPLVNELKVLDKSMRMLNHVAEQMEDFLVDNDLEGWEYKSHVRDAQYASGFKSSIVSNELGKIKAAVKVDRPYIKFGLDEAVEKAKKDLQPVYQKLEDLSTLQREVERVITNARSGKKALESLKHLGIDMSDFKEENEKLPSVQKLSVDPCLVNGGCK